MTDPNFIVIGNGKRFHPFAPDPRCLDLETIAATLSKICRWGGHTREFYCPTPDQRILTADLRWVPAGDLRVGDELTAFDENPHELGAAGKRRRRFRHSVVTHAKPVKRKVIRLEMRDGSTVTASAEHPWLIATKQSRNQKWVPSNEIADAIGMNRKRYMHRFFTPWKTDVSWQSGWLAGILDGEGYVSTKKRRGMQIGMAQNPGIVLSKMEEIIKHFGFDQTKYIGARKTNVGVSRVENIQINGGFKEIMRVLGQIRPYRLLEKLKTSLRTGEFTKQLDGKNEPPEIVRAYEEKEQWVSGIETSTHTYFCEGFGAHNSVAEHSVRGAALVADRLKFAFSLHDAPEAISGTGDIQGPIKPYVYLWHPTEERLMSVEEYETDILIAIMEAVGCHDISVEDWQTIYAADKLMCATEARDLMPPDPWHAERPKLSERIEPWTMAKAEAEFLHWATIWKGLQV